MEENLPSQTIRPLPPSIRVLSWLRTHLRASAALFRKKWYCGTNLQAIGFIVTIEKFIFAKFVQKVNFELNMGVALSKFFWIVLISLRVLRESCFKVRKAWLDEDFNHWNVYFCYFCTKNRLLAITVWEGGCGDCWIWFILISFISGIRAKLF